MTSDKVPDTLPLSISDDGPGSPGRPLGSKVAPPQPTEQFVPRQNGDERTNKDLHCNSERHGQLLMIN